jgi:general nucleoside transport system permease protein
MSGVGGALGILADAAFWTAAIAIAAPLLFATLGAMVCGEAGIVFLGIDGTFTAGAFAALLTAHFSEGHWLALLVAVFGGAFIGLTSTILTSPLNLPQRTTGLAITLLLTGLCQLIYSTFAADPTALGIIPFGPIDLSWLSQFIDVTKISELPYVGVVVRALFHATPPVYLVLVLVFVVSHIINQTPLGLAMRACGQNPGAVTVQGLSVHGLRVGAGAVGAALMALGGGTLALTGGSAFSLSTAAGRGFAALVLAMIAGWRTGRCFLAVLAFAMVDAYQFGLQHLLGGPIALNPAPLLPYVIVLVVLLATSRSTTRRFPLAADY